MKRHGNLFDNIISSDNLIKADKIARNGKIKSYGVKRHDLRKLDNIELLHETLSASEFKTSPYTIFKIYDPKERDIYRLPYYPDRIVHHAIMNYLEPIFVSVFTNDTYSCIKGKGIHNAALNLKRALKDSYNTKYCLKFDVKKFYPSIDHLILKDLLRRKIKDQRVLEILDEIIDSAPGVPIGNYLSQYFANFYLSYFDHYIKEQKGIKYYFRYADDVVILHSDKQFLHSLFKDISQYLFDNLKLTIKNNWQVYPVNSRGIDFIGYVFFHTHTKLRKGIKQRFCRKVNDLKRRNISHDNYKHQISSWMGWAKHCDSRNLIKKII